MIIGRSGAGKSTLLYQMGLLDHPTSGTIILGDIDTGKLDQTKRTHLRLTELGYIFQDYALVPELTASENVMIPLLMKGNTPKDAKNKALEALVKVGIGTKAGNLPSQLSGGEQQRVSVARAIADKPKIVFADEPTANLDSESAQKIIDLFIELNRAGQTLVMVTHEEEYTKLADRVVTLRDGKILSIVERSK
jgi:putative ABC transport system ATP-binding protein